MPRMLAFRRVNRTLVHSFPPQRRQAGYDLRSSSRQVFSFSIYENTATMPTSQKAQDNKHLIQNCRYSTIPLDPLAHHFDVKY